MECYEISFLKVFDSFCSSSNNNNKETVQWKEITNRMSNIYHNNNEISYYSVTMWSNYNKKVWIIQWNASRFRTNEWKKVCTVEIWYGSKPTLEMIIFQ